MQTAIQQMNAEFGKSFMRPQAYRGADIQEQVMEAGLDLEDDGIYCRLSASGYMDCTDWHGPFPTMEEAAQALIDAYGN